MIEFPLSISNHLFFLLFLTIILIIISLLLELHRVLKGGVHAINIDVGKGDFVSFFVKLRISQWFCGKNTTVFIMITSCVA